MGGKEAKERRRLKRLEMQQKANEESKTKLQEEKLKKSTTVPQNKVSPKSQSLSNKTSGTKRKFEKTFKDKENSTNNRTSGPNKMKSPENKSTKKKFKKPKHLSRKLKETTDPEEALLLQKQKVELDKVKAKRAVKFEKKVIGLVGGEEFFDKSEFDRIMENGGAQLENIVKAVKKRDDSDINEEYNNPEAKEDDLSEIRENETDHNKSKSTNGGAQLENIVNAVFKKRDDLDVNEENNNSEAIEDHLSESPKNETDHNKSKSTEENTNDETGLSNETKSGEEILQIEITSNPATTDSPSTTSSDCASSDSDESDDDDGENYALPPTRSRGRKRKGREETDAKREALNEQLKKEKQGDTQDKKTPKSKDKRRCIGRKPLTDFSVGKKYPGKVVYIKPNMGIFFDINAHSDAFCHISRVSDEYIESINEDFCKIGDVFEDKIRVIDIDRTKKRITVSLQSDSRIADEERSNNTWKDRKQQKEKKSTQSWGRDTFASRQINDAPLEKPQKIKVTSVEKNKQYTAPQIESRPIVIDEANMTPAELKRARKLQRRAERRMQQELTGISA